MLQAIDRSANDSTVLYTYSYLLNMMGRFDEAMQFVNRAKAIDPLTVAYFNYETICLYLLQRYDEAINVLQEALQLYPSVLRLYDYLGRIYLTMEKYEEAVDAILAGLRTATIRPPSMIAYLTGAYAGQRQETA